MQEDPVPQLSKFSRVKGSPARKPSNARRPPPPVPLDEVFFDTPNPVPPSGECERNDKLQEEVYLNDRENVYTDATSGGMVNEGHGGPVSGAKRILPPPPCWTPVLPNTAMYYEEAESLPRKEEGPEETIRPMSEYSEFEQVHQDQPIYNDAESVPGEFEEGELYAYIPDGEEGGAYYHITTSDELDSRPVGYYNSNSNNSNNNNNNNNNNRYYDTADSGAPGPETSAPLPRIVLPCSTTPASAAERKPLGQHLGTRVIMNGLNTARLKEKRSNLRPGLSMPPAPVNLPPEPEIDSQQFSGLTLSEKRMLFEARLSGGSSGAPSSNSGPPPLGRRNLGSTGTSGRQASMGISGYQGTEASTGTSVYQGTQASTGTAGQWYPGTQGLVSHNVREESTNYGPGRPQGASSVNNPTVYPARSSTSSLSGSAVRQGSHSRGGSLVEDEVRGSPGDPVVKNNGFRTMPPPAAVIGGNDLVKVDKNVELDSCSWYWHKSSRPACEKALNSINEEGAFLVRDNHKSDPGKPYTLSMMHEREIYTLAIRIKPNRKYALASEKENEKEFTSLPEMIGYHQEHPILIVRRGGVGGSGQVWLKVCF